MKLRVWNCGKFEEMKIGQRVLVGHCGSGRSVFGELATLTRTTKLHLVFTTDSGTIVKTAIDNLHKVIGKAGQQHIFVSTRIEGRENFYHSPVHIY